jgi:ribosomal protein S17E
MSDRESKKLLNRIASLEKQNSKLKKELSKHKKYVSKAADLLMDRYESSEDIDSDYEEKPSKQKFCENCGKGDIKIVKVLNFTFDICTLCQYRKKTK